MKREPGYVEGTCMGVHEGVHWWETGGRLAAWFDVLANGVLSPG